MQVAEIELYEILKEKVGDKEAKTLVEYIEAKVEKKFDEKKDILATKFDIGELRSATKLDIEGLRSATKLDIEGLRSATKLDIEELRLATKLDIEGLRTEMQKMKADIIKWMFLFWIGQLASLIAILQIFFR